MGVTLKPGESPFSRIGTIRASVNSSYYRAGRYLMHIDAFKVSDNRKGEGFVVFESTVVAVLSDVEAAKEPAGAHRVGEKVSWLMKFAADTTMPNLKAAILAITGVPEDQITEQFMLELAGNAQPLKGIFVEFENKVITTKAGKPFTRVAARRKWSKADVEANVPAEVLTHLKLDTKNAD